MEVATPYDSRTFQYSHEFNNSKHHSHQRPSLQSSQALLVLLYAKGLPPRMILKMRNLVTFDVEPHSHDNLCLQYVPSSSCGPPMSS